MKTTITMVGLALAAAAASASGAGVRPDAAETARNLDIISEAFALWREGEPVFAALLSDDVVWTIPGSGRVAGTYRGKASFIADAAVPLTSRLATPLVPEVHAIWAQGDTVIVRFDAGAMTTSGAPYRNQFVWILTLEDGEVVRGEAFLDLAAYQKVVDENEPKRD